MRLDLFPAREAWLFLPDLPAADFLTAYAVCGGYPLHLEQWDQPRPLEENLAFWFGVLRDDVDLIEGGQGDAVRHRWQASPLDNRDLLELQRKTAYAPEPAANVTFAFWTRTGAAEPGFPASVYSADDVIDG